MTTSFSSPTELLAVAIATLRSFVDMPSKLKPARLRDLKLRAVRDIEAASRSRGEHLGIIWAAELYTPYVPDNMKGLISGLKGSQNHWALKWLEVINSRINELQPHVKRPKAGAPRKDAIAHGDLLTLGLWSRGKMTLTGCIDDMCKEKVLDPKRSTRAHEKRLLRIIGKMKEQAKSSNVTSERKGSINASQAASIKARARRNLMAAELKK